MFPAAYRLNSLKGDPSPFVRRFLWQFYQLLPPHIKDASSHPPTRILPPQIYVPLFNFILLNVQVRWCCLQQTHFGSCYINWRFTSTSVTDYVDLDHQKISTLAFFPIASIDPESVLNWLENLSVERAVLKHFRVGSFLHSKFLGGKRERDRIRVVPISRVTNVKTMDLDRFFIVVLRKYYSFRKVPIFTPSGLVTRRGRDLAGYDYEVLQKEGEFYKRAKKAVNRLRGELEKKDRNRSVLMC
ncbi:hypothetical protein TrCOL_g1542 [Triparma columacea]|uniref:Uncharacterized protein n=1 Tax=Triparma columacea TaxID=722753 RepID=A0A9W7GAD7_9STRA|nr:hypothetical protein TrCOL_g1542 [Triparma columacea]